MKYKTLEIEMHCTCGEGEDTSVFLVVDETLTIQELTQEHDPARVLCEAFTQEGADMIVRALNGPTLN